jgi:hypothetical protein
MKKMFILSLFAVSLFVVSCSNADNVGADKASTAHIDPENPPVMTFPVPLYDFGTISQGQKVRYHFEFTNTGKSDLLIQSASGSCGCTVPKNYPKDPISPGGSGKIEVVFDSEHKTGKQDVSVTILANTVPSKNEVKLTGFVATPQSN